VQWKSDQIVIALLALTLLSACAEKPDPPRALGGADAGHGLILVRTHGCAACHQIPGVDWPRGQVGGPLRGFADRGLIAGRLPNQPDTLVAWLRDPPALSPQTAMPASGLSSAEARDVAAFLYTLDER
jgi:cytochrome c1